MAGNVDQNTFRQILFRNIALPLALGVVSCAVFVGLIFYIMDLNGWVYKTNVVLIKINNIEKSYLESVASLRGFLLTQNSSYLEPYNSTEESFEKKFDDLAQTVSDNESQVRNAQQLKEKFKDWITFANQVLEVNRKSGQQAALEFRMRETGGRVRGAVTDGISEFREIEETLRDQRVERQHEFVRIAMMSAIVLSLLFGALIAIFGRKQLLGLSSSYEEILEKQAVQNNILSIQNWMKTGQAELGVVLTNDMSMSELSEAILQYLAEFLKAKVGVMYIANAQNEFEVRSTYAYPLEKSYLKSFKVGQTLLGQVAKNGEIVQTKDVPSEYFKVSSGLGEMNPKNILLVPIRYNKDVNALLELGFTEEIPQQSIEWLKSVNENIGTAVKTAKYKEHLEILLEEVQNQAEELQSQQEELRVNNEELEEQAKVLRETQSRLEAQHAELEQTNAQLEEQAQALESQAESLNEKNHELNLTQDDLKKKAQELQQASQYKSEFLANMSHELRTPLNSSLILAKLLADNKSQNLSPQQVEYAEQILSSGNDLLNLINDILDLSKVEAGKLEVNPEDIGLKKFVNGLERVFQPLAKEKDLTFNVEIASDVPKQITTDPLRLEQVLKNLLSNAIKFTQKGSVALKVTKSKDYSTFVDFVVVDTGIGIDEDKRDVIFEAFRQADGTTNRMFGGTGLGLSISKNLAELLGGKITVESSLGQGSTFTISVPEVLVSNPIQDPVSKDKAIVSRIAQLTVKPKVTPPEIKRKPFLDDDREFINLDSNVVLIVEDDENFAKVLQEMAKAAKFQCVITDHASEAIEIAQKIKPQAILLDVKLPDHSGLVVLDQLKQNPKTRHIPVHMISGVDFIKDALEMGAVGYALKPTKEEELKKVFTLLQEKISETIQKVLIVEDDKIQREAIKHLIRDDRVQTIAVGTGKEALLAIEKENFNCVIVDLNLPDMSGFELLEKLPKIEESNLPVIVYTGRDLTSSEEDRLRKHSKSVIVKGAKSPDRLLSEVTLFLHQVETKLDPERQKMLEELRSREKIFESKKILVVDDDMRNVFALTAALEQKGAKVVVAKNGQESLNKLEEGAVDIVLMDIMMPVMDGYTAMREIRKQSQFDKIPIIALTAKAMKDDRDLCIQAGANDYLPKPVDVEKLLSLIRVWISHSGRA